MVKYKLINNQTNPSASAMGEKQLKQNKKMKIVHIVLGVVNAFLRAFVLWKLYGWFILPLGAPIISIGHIYGIVLLYSVFMMNSKDIRQVLEREQNNELDIKVALFSTSFCLISLGIAYFLK